jgi:hypothetical protein
MACERGDIQILKLLIKAREQYAGNARYVGSGARDIDMKLLDIAVERGHLDIVRTLLTLKSLSRDPKQYENADDYVRRDAFIEAVKKGNLDMIKAFIEAYEDVSDERDEYNRAGNGKTLIQIAAATNQSAIVTCLKEAKKKQLIAVAEKESIKEKLRVEALAAQEQKLKKENDADMKMLLDKLDHPLDLYGLSSSRYRKFNGKVYDCAEPIDFLNRLTVYIYVSKHYNDHKSSMIDMAGRMEIESKWLKNNPWIDTFSDSSLSPILVEKVMPDGLIVRLNSQQDEKILVFLKNHPRQTTATDGDALVLPTGTGDFDSEHLFVRKEAPYKYRNAHGDINTIPSYDFGVVVPMPSGSIDKLPAPRSAL